MFEKLKQLFRKKTEAQATEPQISFVSLRTNIEAWALEIYKGITIVYLAKPIQYKDPQDPLDQRPPKRQPIYHLFHNNTLIAGEAETLAELKELAHNDIDNNFKDKK